MSSSGRLFLVYSLNGNVCVNVYPRLKYQNPIFSKFHKKMLYVYKYITYIKTKIYK